MIKAFAFDFGGVVIPGIFLSFVGNLPKDDPRVTYFEEASHKWDLGELSVDEFYDALSYITGIGTKTLKETIYDKAELYPEVLEIIKKLKNHYKLILFTNNFTHNVERYFDALNLHGIFDEVIVSSEHKIKKPDPAFYNVLLTKLGLSPSEILFIDDSQVNVDAAEKLGITSLLFTDPQTLKADLNKKRIIIGKHF